MRTIPQIAIFIFCLLAFKSYANEELFTIKDVKVYAESDNLDNAKQDANGLAVQKAFKQMLMRMVPRIGQWKIDVIPANFAFEAVLETIPQTERMTSDSYTASITVKFDAKTVKNLLNKAGMIYSDAMQPPVLIFPVLKEGDNLYLWQDDDDWIAAWNNAPLYYGLSRFIYAIGDLIDAIDNDVKNVAKDGFVPSRKTMERYDAAVSAVIIAEVKDDLIEAKINVKTGMVNRNLKATTPFNNQDAIGSYKVFIAEVIAVIDDDYKGALAAYNKTRYQSRLLYKTKDLANTSADLIEKRLRSIDVIDDVKRTELDEKQTVFDINYVSRPEKLSRILKNHGMKIEEAENNMQEVHIVTNEN